MEKEKQEEGIVLATDIVILGIEGQYIYTLLVKRTDAPFKGMWALPGGRVGIDETPYASAKRSLYKETGLKGIYLRQFGVFGDLERDPRGRFVSISYMGLVDVQDEHVGTNTIVKNARWFDVNNLPEIGFDHKEIIAQAAQRLHRPVWPL